MLEILSNQKNYEFTLSKIYNEGKRGIADRLRSKSLTDGDIYMILQYWHPLDACRPKYGYRYMCTIMPYGMIMVSRNIFQIPPLLLAYVFTDNFHRLEKIYRRYNRDKLFLLYDFLKTLDPCGRKNLNAENILSNKIYKEIQEGKIHAKPRN